MMDATAQAVAIRKGEECKISLPFSLHRHVGFVGTLMGVDIVLSGLWVSMQRFRKNGGLAGENKGVDTG